MVNEFPPKLLYMKTIIIIHEKFLLVYLGWTNSHYMSNLIWPQWFESFEGVRINHDQSDILMNSKSEFHQPAETQVTTTREVRSGGN